MIFFSEEVWENIPEVVTIQRYEKYEFKFTICRSEMR